jgi:uncharacterized membrane protein
MHRPDTFWGVFYNLMPLIFLLAATGLIVWAVLRMSERKVRAGAGQASPMAPAAVDKALEELRLRYARGEMSREEFAMRGRDLGLDVGVPATGGEDTGG